MFLLDGAQPQQGGGYSGLIMIVLIMMYIAPKAY